MRVRRTAVDLECPAPGWTPNQPHHRGQPASEVAFSTALLTLATKIRRAHAEVERAACRSLEQAIAAGERLLEAKRQLRHGQWLRWLQDQVGIPDRTARLYMGLARGRPIIDTQIGNVADFTIRAAVSCLAKRAIDSEAESIARRPVIVPRGRFETAVVDPPWPCRWWAPLNSGLKPPPYPTMSEYEIDEFGKTTLRELLADDAHVFLWVPQAFLPTAFRFIENWGLEYRGNTFTWFKRGGPQRPGSPKHNSEHAIHAVCGRPDFINTRDFPTCFEGVRREHSRKPDEFYDRLRRVTRGPRVDMFSREKRDGFAQFGNETDKFPRPLESTNRSLQQRTVDAAPARRVEGGKRNPSISGEWH
jgi:N6-adenosine-specific RNA methylase IME4